MTTTNRTHRDARAPSDTLISQASREPSGAGRFSITTSRHSAHGAPTRGWLPLGAAVEDHAHLVGVGVRASVGRRVRVEVGGWGWA